jgi:hypothetical protein
MLARARREGRGWVAPEIPDIKVRTAKPGYRWVQVPEAVAASYEHVGVMDREQFEADWQDMFDLLYVRINSRVRVRDALLYAAALGTYRLGDYVVTFDPSRGYSFGSAKPCPDCGGGYYPEGGTVYCEHSNICPRAA